MCVYVCVSVWLSSKYINRIYNYSFRVETNYNTKVTQYKITTSTCPFHRTEYHDL